MKPLKNKTCGKCGKYMKKGITIHYEKINGTNKLVHGDCIIDASSKFWD